MTDYTDLMQRLRNAHENSAQRIVGSMIFAEAADAIAALQAEVARLVQQTTVAQADKG